MRRCSSGSPRSSRSCRAFDYRLAEIRRFPVSLYLAPQPDEFIRARSPPPSFASFPTYPPFDGKFTTVVPHVTVAHGDEPQLCEIEVELRIALVPAAASRHAAPR